MQKSFYSTHTHKKPVAAVKEEEPPKAAEPLNALKAKFRWQMTSGN